MNTIFRVSDRQVIPRPLDLVPTTAWGAWSIARRMKGSYTGDLIRVRRDHDNAETNIGQRPDGTLDTDAIRNFYLAVGIGDVFVTTIFDQSGSGHHIGIVAAANQPQINDGFPIQGLTGFPVAYFSGSDHMFVSSSVALPISTVFVFDPASWCPFDPAYGYIFDGGYTSGYDDNQTYQDVASPSLTYRYDDGTWGPTISNVANGQLHFCQKYINTSATSRMAIDGVLASPDDYANGSGGPNGLTIAASGQGVNKSQIDFYEAAIWAADIATVTWAHLTNVIHNMAAYYRRNI